MVLMNIGIIIRKARVDAKLALTTVAAATGVAASVQSKIELGDIVSPSFIVIAKLARFYNLNLEGIFEAAETNSDSPLAAAKALKCHHIPIISWVQAGEWNDSPLTTHDFEVIPAPFKCSDEAYALEVRGDSMTAAPGASYSFPEGALIIVEPNAEPRHNNFVVSRLEGTDDVTFKRLITDGGKYLQPLNPQYPIIPINQPMQVCGVVIGVVQKVVW